MRCCTRGGGINGGAGDGKPEPVGRVYPGIGHTSPGSVVAGKSRLVATGIRVLLALAMIATAGCGPKTGGAAKSVALFFTAQTHGRLTPCGCFSGQFGGLSRLKTALAAGPYAGGFGVDVGDALEGPEDFQLLKYKQVVRAYAEMNYVALNAGHREAGLSLAKLRELGAGSPVPLISANLVERSSGRAVLRGWTVIKRDGRRIALVGVVDPAGLEETLGEGLAVERMETCLARILPEVKREADVLVLLAFTDEAGLTALAKQFYEFSVILGGRVSQPAQALLRENQSLIYYTANESKSFGGLELLFGAAGEVSAGRHEIALLHDRIAQSEEVLALAAEYRAEVRRMALAIDDPKRAQANQVPGRNGATYAGTESCIGCHVTAGNEWNRSRHAHAFETLVERDSDADPSCIVCHTVGFGSPGGYRREFKAEKLTKVGCESCHGPGATHVAQRLAGGVATFQFRPLGAGDCMKCHHGEFSRPFDMDKFWPVIAHGKEAKP